MDKRTALARFRGPRKGPLPWFFFGADDGIRTRDPHLGKMMRIVQRLRFTLMTWACVHDIVH
jgi:hypothetical protein